MSKFRPHALAAAAATVASVLTLAHTPTAQAANCTWNPASGNWASSANWSCSLVPGAADSATIAVAKVVTVDSVQSILNLNNAGSVNLDAFLLNLVGGGSTTNTGTINVGAGPIPNNAALQVAGGHHINNAGGVINVSADSVLNQFGSTITGGTINTTGTGRLVAFNSGSNFLSGVTLGGTLDMASATGIERITGGLTFNNGTVNIGANSILAPQGDQSFSGTGQIVFADDGNGSNRFNVEAGNLTLGSNITVRGGNGTVGGQTFAGGAATLTNNGTINADVASRSINLAVGGLVTNNGTLAANNGGTLVISSNVVGGAGSQITAGAGSVVLQNGVSLSGALNISGAGSLRASNSGSNFLSGVTLAGTLDLASATGIERVASGLTLNNATVNIAANSIFAPQGDQTIGGTGSFVFINDGSGSNRFNVEAGNLTLASGVTIHGHSGLIGGQSFAGGAASLTNHGTIAADVAGGTISIGIGGALNNHGTLAALNGGTLVLNSAVNNLAGSQLQVGAASTMLQNGVALNGTINVVGGGNFRASNNGNNFLNNASFTGVLDLASATGIERVAGGLVLNGTVNIGANSTLAPQGNQTFSGNGQIVFADANGSNRLNVEAGNLTLASGITVRGGNGVIGAQSFAGGAATLTNHGTISADENGRSITLAVSGLTTNHGTLSALNGGTLVLNSAVTGVSGSQILAGAGSVVQQNGITLAGNMNLIGAGSFRASNNGSNFLSGVTLSGILDLASATGIERVAGGLTLGGATINIGANSTFAPQGDQTIGGTGSIVFTDANGSNRFNVEAGNLTLGSGVTVRGGNGVIGAQSFAGGAATLTNQGLIAADEAGRSITLTTTSGTINQSLMKASNGGTLIFNTGVNNSAGTLRAEAGSVVLFNGVTVTGGVLDSTGSGVLRVSNSSNNFLNGTTLNGVLDMASATSVARISNGGMVLNGRINMGANSTFAPQGDQIIGGTGVIHFADANGSNRLNVEAGNLTLGAGVTVDGVSGVIGGQAFAGGAATLTNLGTINANGGGVISIAPTSTFTNDGLLRAENGTLAIGRNVGGTGTLQVDAAGVMTLANGGNTQGKLLMGNAGAAINIGTGNLVITNDYTNDGAGSGNSFNRRAGVSGAGQVVAGGNVAQVISGAGVSNGNTNNATLTLGNVRVGATTFNYQVGNAGSTGPTLRGAIQTNVNGGNISDARLSGAGVTAANYNAGAPGGNSGNLAVTFTAASAGALAPLVGQVINLRSNFENVADQKLNLVLANGAAAFNAAIGAATPSPVVVANQRVGGSNLAGLSISNTAAAGSFSEDLNTSFSALSGAAFGNGGSVNGLLAGASNTTAMKVGVDTTTAGAKSGTVSLAYETAGAVNGVSNGLGTASVGSQQLQVSGNVFQLASGAIQTAPLNFGTVQVGQVVQRDLVIRNTASGASGFVEDLNASFGAATDARITGAGSFAGILAGNNSAAGNGSMTVGVNTGAAGVVNGSIRVNYTSAGAVAGVSNGLGLLAVGNEDYAVNGTIDTVANVINQASPLVNTPSINLGAVRVGAASPTALVSVTNQATTAPQAALNASIATGGTPITASGGFNLLAPGGTNSNTLQVGLATGTAGNFTGANAGTAVISFVSDANNVGNCAPDCQLNLGSQNISVSGKVYNQAIAQLNTTAIDFGVVRVGQAVAAQSINVSNVAANTALNDTLRANLSGVSGPVSAPAFVAGIGAGGNADFAVNLNTAAAGTVGFNATLAFLSQNADMSDVSAGADGQVSISATINNLANADFDLLGALGVLSQNGESYVLDLGNVALGTNLATLLRLDNDVAGPADMLSGNFDLSAADDFALSGWGSVAGLGAGDHVDALAVNFFAGQLGQYSDSITFNGLGTNASDPQGLAQTRRLTIRANVFDPDGQPLPEPGSLALALVAAVGLALAQRRRQQQRGSRLS